MKNKKENLKLEIDPREFVHKCCDTLGYELTFPTKSPSFRIKFSIWNRASSMANWMSPPTTKEGLAWGIGAGVGATMGARVGAGTGARVKAGTGAGVPGEDPTLVPVVNEVVVT